MDESSLKLTASEMMQHESITNTGTAMTDGASTIRGVDGLASLELGMPFNTYIEHMHSDLAFHKIGSENIISLCITYVIIWWNPSNQNAAPGRGASQKSCF